MGSLRPGASPQDPIVTDYDDPVSCAEDLQIIGIRRLINEYRPQRRQQSLDAGTDDVDEQEDEEDASVTLRDFIDLTVDEYPSRARRSRRRPHQPVARDPERYHDRIQRHDDLWLKVNTFYEIDSDDAPKSAVKIHFILVTDIIENLRTRELKVRGMPFGRSRNLMGKLPRKLNEVFKIYELEEDDDVSAEQQAKIEISAAALVRPRTLHVTNAPYPKHRYHPQAFGGKKAVEREGPLVCRWKFFIHYRDSRKKHQQKAHHWSIVRISSEEVRRDDFRVKDHGLRTQWRGQTILGGSCKPDFQTSNSPVDNQRYTVFDAFSGAGGFSRGAERAGFQVKYAVDHWDKACQTYRLNFPHTRLFEMSVDEFLLAQKDVDMRTDILHLSPPCQTWSPAHTVPGVNDEANIASLFACRSLIEKLRPRVFTLEQTFGILHPCHDPFFCTLIGGFTEFGYSVTWKLVHLQTWGLPQKRKRLIMIGACPGEKLPPFPKASHSETGAGGLLKYVTVRQALERIDDTSTFHNPEEEIRDSFPRDSVISKPDQILPRCMTCSGGMNWHWSRIRGFTVREFASLQGFPVWHKFSPASKAVLKKQIGNAFPACVVRYLCEHLKIWLLETDGLVPPRALRSSVGGRELVFMSDSPRSETTPEAILPLEINGGSPAEAILVDDDDDDDQCDIKFYDSSDTEMGDMFDVPDSPRSATMSLGSTPEPFPEGCTLATAMVID